MELKAGYKQTEVGIIPEDWDISTVGQEFSVQLGKMLDAEKNTGVPKSYLGNRSVQWDRIDTNDLQTMLMSPSDIMKFRLRQGDLLVCEGGDVGRSAIWQAPIEEFYYQKALHRLRPLHNFDPRLMVAILRRYSDQGFLANYVTQTSIAHLPREKLLELPIPNPPKQEQTAIASALSDMDALLDGLDRLITKKRNLKQAAMQQLLTGKTRLAGFEGEWDVKTLNEVCWFQEGPGVRNTQFTTSGVKLLNGTNIFLGKLNLETTNRFISEKEAHGAYAHFLADEGDIVLASSGISIDRLHEKVAFVREQDLPFCMNTSTIRFKPAVEILDSKFLFQFLTSDGFKKPIGEQATGSAQLNFGPSHVALVDISIPPLPEQTAIAAVLADMDAEIAALEQRRTKTRDIKQGMMQELLTGRTRLV
jgi:type I restriction enzyme S subunit